MTVKQLHENFDYVLKSKGQYHIHSNNGKRSVYKYLATVNKKGNSFYVTGFKPTTKIDKLKQQIQEYSNSLPYDSEYYSPLYREGIKEELIVIDYLNSINFERPTYNSSDIFELNRKSIYDYQATNISLSFRGLDCWNDIPETVDVILWVDNFSFFSSTCKRDATEIIKTIDSLLKPLLVTESINNIKTSDKLTMSDIDVKLNKIINLDIKQTDVKQYLKQQLLDIAKTL